MTRGQLERIRELAEQGDLSGLWEKLGVSEVHEMLAIMDDAIKLAAKAMTGGNITRADVDRMSALCKLIGHEP